MEPQHSAPQTGELINHAPFAGAPGRLIDCSEIERTFGGPLQLGVRVTCTAPSACCRPAVPAARLRRLRRSGGETFGHGPGGSLPRAIGHEWDLSVATLARMTH